jgi:carboxylate-amine ligase
MRYPFEPSPRPTLGIEEEYQICDPQTGVLVPKVDGLMRHADEELRRWLSYDLIQGLIETATGVAENVAEGMADIAEKRRRIQELAEAEGCTLGITGTHPYADPRSTVFVENESYRWVRGQLHYVARRNITFGMHVHVGVSSAERAVYVNNRMRRWIGPLIALAANSPFLDEVDTGWDSARSFTFGTFPRSGIPPTLRSYGHFEEMMARMTEARSIEKMRHIWWNVRPHPMYGTVEVRACDVQMSLRRTALIVALSQALIVAYGDRHAAGEAEPPLERAYLEDGRFKGMRFGLDCEVIDAETGEVMPMREQVRAMVEFAGDAAARLGTESYLEEASVVLEQGNGAADQRRLAAELGGNLERLQLRLLEQAREQIASPDLSF